LVIRTDAGTRIGSGHLMRCIALAQAWVDEGGEALVLMGPGQSPAEGSLAEEHLEIRHLDIIPGCGDDARETVRAAEGLGAGWVVLDGYHFDGDYQRTLKESGLSLLLIDDLGQAGPYHADIILNPNLYADEMLYRGAGPSTRFLIGPRYALLRREFAPWRGRFPEIPGVARRILLSLGGADPGNITLAMIGCLQGLAVEGLGLVVVAGANNPHYQTLEARIAGLRNITLVQDTRHISELMASSDLAITGGGVTCFELAFMGVPALVVILSENQRPVAESFERAGSAVNLGEESKAVSNAGAERILGVICSPDIRRSLSRSGQDLVDGDGAGRIVMQLKGEPFRLRRARESDCRLLWEWANDPEVRRNAFSQDTIPWKDHVIWFRGRLADSRCVHFCAFDAGDRPIGQIRFDLKGGEAEVDVSIDRNLRSRGYGSALIRAGVVKIARIWNPGNIIARVRKGNTASIQSFQKAGFAIDKEEEVGGSRVVRLKWNGSLNTGRSE
jgi:UDP-2,4-diacetamido-2,4,6-trideoxy-beta-L-altropyranose hydrolase